MKIFQGFARKLLVIFVILTLYLLVFSIGLFEKATGYHFKTAHCEDTDGGSIFIKGIVMGYTDYNAEFEKEDYCSLDDTKQLKEYKCNLLNPNNWEYDIVDCTNGCSDGACIK